MTWAKLDDHFPEHPKVVGISDRAFRLHITALCYASRQLTDGRLPKALPPAFGARQRDLVELIEAGLWESNGDGWLIHDYLDYNPSRADVEEQRKLFRERAQRAAQARWKGHAKHA